MFGKKKKIQPVMCAALGEVEANGLGQTTLITGTVSGHLYVWLQEKVVKAVTAHDAPIYTIAKVGDKYATGGKEGLVKIWSQDLTLLGTHNIQLFSPEPYVFAVHSVRANLAASKIVVGMKGGELYELALKTHSSILLIESHSKKEMYGLVCNPQNGDEYVTTGDDGVVRVWGMTKKSCLRRLSLESASRAVAWSPDGKILIIGIGGDPSSATKDGAKSHTKQAIF